MKVAIIGTVPHTRAMAPWDDKSWEMWICSPGNAYGEVKRASKWFELHGIIDLKGAENASWNSRYFGWLQQQTFPVYMQEPNDLVPNASIFPMQRVYDAFQPYSDLIFTSSVTWMAAYALMLGASDIAIFGVDMAANEEQYSGQKTGCQLLMILAKERYDIDIQTPLESSLSTKPALYGLAEASHMGRYLWVHELMLTDKFTGATQAVERAQMERQFIAGQLEALKFFRRTFVDGRDALSALSAPPTKVAPVHRPHMGTFEMGSAGLLVPKVNGAGEPHPDAGD